MRMFVWPTEVPFSYLSKGLAYCLTLIVFVSPITEIESHDRAFSKFISRLLLGFLFFLLPFLLLLSRIKTRRNHLFCPPALFFVGHAIRHSGTVAINAAYTMPQGPKKNAHLD